MASPPDPDDDPVLNIFINCPYDKHYQALFDAIVFAVHACGLRARCAKEADNGADTRINKISSRVSAGFRRRNRGFAPRSARTPAA